MNLRTPEENIFSFDTMRFVCRTREPAFSSVTLLVSLMSGIFVLLKLLRDGPNQNQSYLTITLLYFYLLSLILILMFGKTLKEKKLDGRRLLGGLFFVSFSDIFPPFRIKDQIS